MKKWVVLAVVMIAPLCGSTAATGRNSSASSVSANSDAIVINSDGKAVQNHITDKPVTSSGPPAAPVPPAGWIGLVGLLGVIALRWFQLARRSWSRTAQD